MIHDVAIEELSQDRYPHLAAEGKVLFEEYEAVVNNFLGYPIVPEEKSE
jgi:hypothetical protein